jgi:hypothetical protein
MDNTKHGAMPGVVTPIDTHGAINTDGLTPDLTNNLNFSTDGTPMKALMQPPVPTPSPTRAAILAVLTKLIHTPDVFSAQALTAKKRHKASTEDTTI